ncbi:MAG: GNAT family N-acetyltransferase [Proteobacteria bacterium]|nr:GNAT family N-acetyltransferase [Pseudomonadota bacterium]
MNNHRHKQTSLIFLFVVLMGVILNAKPALTLKIKAFESAHIIFQPFTAQKDDYKKIKEILTNKEVMKYSYGVRREEWIKMLIKNQLAAGEVTPLGAWILYLKDDHSFMGICGFASGNKDTNFKASPGNPEGKGDPYPEGGGLRDDGRTELGTSSILLFPTFTSYESEITSALIQYAFDEVPELIGIDFGVEGKNQPARKDMEQKKLPLVVPPYEVNRGPGYPQIKMYVYRCDRNAYFQHFPIVIKN